MKRNIREQSAADDSQPAPLKRLRLSDQLICPDADPLALSVLPADQLRQQQQQQQHDIVLDRIPCNAAAHGPQAAAGVNQLDRSWQLQASFVAEPTQAPPQEPAAATAGAAAADAEADPANTAAAADHLQAVPTAEASPAAAGWVSVCTVRQLAASATNPTLGLALTRWARVCFPGAVAGTVSITDLLPRSRQFTDHLVQQHAAGKLKRTTAKRYLWAVRSWLQQQPGLLATVAGEQSTGGILADMSGGLVALESSFVPDAVSVGEARGVSVLDPSAAVEPPVSYAVRRTPTRAAARCSPTFFAAVAASCADEDEEEEQWGDATAAAAAPAAANSGSARQKKMPDLHAGQGPAVSLDPTDNGPQHALQAEMELTAPAAAAATAAAAPAIDTAPSVLDWQAASMEPPQQAATANRLDKSFQPKAMPAAEAPPPPVPQEPAAAAAAAAAAGAPATDAAAALTAAAPADDAADCSPLDINPATAGQAPVCTVSQVVQSASNPTLRHALNKWVQVCFPYTATDSVSMTDLLPRSRQFTDHLVQQHAAGGLKHTTAERYLVAVRSWLKQQPGLLATVAADLNLGDILGDITAVLAALNNRAPHLQQQPQQQRAPRAVTASLPAPGALHVQVESALAATEGHAPSAAHAHRPPEHAAAQQHSSFVTALDCKGEAENTQCCSNTAAAADNKGAAQQGHQVMSHEGVTSLEVAAAAVGSTQQNAAGYAAAVHALCVCAETPGGGCGMPHLDQLAKTATAAVAAQAEAEEQAEPATEKAAKAAAGDGTALAEHAIAAAVAEDRLGSSMMQAQPLPTFSAAKAVGQQHVPTGNADTAAAAAAAAGSGNVAPGTLAQLKQTLSDKNTKCVFSHWARDCFPGQPVDTVLVADLLQRGRQFAEGMLQQCARGGLKAATAHRYLHAVRLLLQGRPELLAVAAVGRNPAEVIRELTAAMAALSGEGQQQQHQQPKQRRQPRQLRQQQHHHQQIMSSADVAAPESTPARRPPVRAAARQCRNFVAAVAASCEGDEGVDQWGDWGQWGSTETAAAAVGWGSVPVERTTLDLDASHVPNLAEADTALQGHMGQLGHACGQNMPSTPAAAEANAACRADTAAAVAYTPSVGVDWGVTDVDGGMFLQGCSNTPWDCAEGAADPSDVMRVSNANNAAAAAAGPGAFESLAAASHVHGKSSRDSAALSDCQLVDADDPVMKACASAPPAGSTQDLLLQPGGSILQCSNLQQDSLEHQEHELSFADATGSPALVRERSNLQSTQHVPDTTSGPAHADMTFAELQQVLPPSRGLDLLWAIAKQVYGLIDDSAAVKLPGPAAVQVPESAAVQVPGPAAAATPGPMALGDDPAAGLAAAEQANLAAVEVGPVLLLWADPDTQQDCRDSFSTDSPEQQAATVELLQELQQLLSEPVLQQVLSHQQQQQLLQDVGSLLEHSRQTRQATTGNLHVAPTVPPGQSLDSLLGCADPTDSTPVVPLQLPDSGMQTQPARGHVDEQCCNDQLLPTSKGKTGTLLMVAGSTPCGPALAEAALTTATAATAVTAAEELEAPTQSPKQDMQQSAAQPGATFAELQQDLPHNTALKVMWEAAQQVYQGQGAVANPALVEVKDLLLLWLDAETLDEARDRLINGGPEDRAETLLLLSDVRVLLKQLAIEFALGQRKQQQLLADVGQVMML